MGYSGPNSADGKHSCAIQSGTAIVVCWGRDTYGQAAPADAVNGVTGTATAIAAGDYHSLAIRLPEPSAWLAQTAGLALLCALHRSRARKRKRLTVPI